MSNLLNNGTSGLLAFQRALTTTSNNIANVNTEGYARQRVDLESVVGNTRLTQQTGGGVRVADIERLQDQFATTQLIQTSSAYARQSTHLDLASRIDKLMADDALSITPVLDSFFSSLQDANADPSSLANREIVLGQADQLTNRFQAMQQQLDGLQQEVNDRVQSNVADINELASAVAELNKRIVSTRGVLQGQTPNELMDQRDKLIGELSELVDVRTLEQGDGARNLFIGNGIPLVTGTTNQLLRAVQHDSDPSRLQIETGTRDQWLAVGPHLQGGNLGGLQDFERDTLKPALHELGRMAVTLASKFNDVHAHGRDLNGNAGADMFTVASPLASANENNTGNASLSVDISDVEALRASDYLFRYDGSDFRVTRTSDGETFNSPVPVDIDGLSISLTGSPATGDSFLLSATGHAAGLIETSLSGGEELALGSPLATRSNLDNLGTARVGPAVIEDPTSPGFLNSVDIVFTAADRFDVIDTTTGTTLTSNMLYESGTPVQANGWSVTLNGQAQEGDVHTIEADANGRSSNSNGLGLVGLQAISMIDGNQTINDAYGNLVSQVGGQTRSLQSRSSALDNLKSGALERQQSVQGVNLDEEAVNLTRYQQAYQASAQVIATADTLFQSLLRVVAR